MTDSRLMNPTLEALVHQLIGKLKPDELVGHELGAYRFWKISVVVKDLDNALRMAERHPDHMDIHKRRLQRHLDTYAKYKGAGYINCTGQDVDDLLARAQKVISQ